MMLPAPKALFSVSVGADDAPDDLADTLQEMHGHLATGNYKGAASAMRAAYAICASEKSDHGGGDGNDLYD